MARAVTDATALIARFHAAVCDETLSKRLKLAPCARIAHRANEAANVHDPSSCDTLPLPLPHTASHLAYGTGTYHVSARAAATIRPRAQLYLL